ncbi:MAG: acyl-CoA reductase, partial [Verrucomicrobiota bacterium]
MNLPNYFLADLSDLATLSHQLIADACETLKKNRERFLLPRSTDSTIQVIASLARDWLDRDFPFRKMVFDQGPELTGFTRETLAAGLNQFFAQVTRENLLRLVEQDLGNARRLDEFSSDAGELKSDRSSIARGPELIVHFTGGLIPNPTLTSMIIGLLSRSAQFFKCASGTAFIPRMFAHSLYMADRKFASCIEVAEWKGGTETLDSALFENANCVTATGSDETLAKIYSKVSPRTRFLGYGHKVSLGYVTREMLSRLHHPQLLQSAVDDIIAWNQLGCLSPHVIYVESGGPTAPHDFAEQLALALKDREQSEPRGSIANDASAAITGRRMLYETRSLDGDHTKIW